MWVGWGLDVGLDLRLGSQASFFFWNISLHQAVVYFLAVNATLVVHKKVKFNELPAALPLGLPLEFCH